MEDHDMIVRMDERMKALEQTVQGYDKKLSQAANGVIVTRIGQAAIAVLGLLEVQSRTGVEIGAAKEGFIRFLSIFGIV